MITRHPKTLFAFYGGFLLTLITACIETKPTDYKIELASIDMNLSTVTDTPSRGIIPYVPTSTLRTYWLYQRASLTENVVDTKNFEAQFDAAMRGDGADENLLFLKASIDIKLHRLPAAKQSLQIIGGSESNRKWLLLKGDIALQEGKFEEARSAFENALEEKATWDSLARLAYLESLFGHYTEAESLYLEAQSQLTAKEMRNWAWLQLQRGLLDFHQGRSDKALEHYFDAQAAYSGYWLIDEHLGELFARERRYSEAISYYKKALRQSNKPEFNHSLGDVYTQMGSNVEANKWYERALSGYLASVDQGEVIYLHHLTDFYLNVSRDTSAALIWARRDFQHRPNATARQALAWALHNDGQYQEALFEIKATLSSGIINADLLTQAEIIFRENGYKLESDDLQAEMHFHSVTN